MDIAIIGGGIAGLSLAMNLRNCGIAARVFERARDPVIRESAFFNRVGQLIYQEERLPGGARPACGLSLSGGEHSSWPPPHAGEGREETVTGQARPRHVWVIQNR